MRTPCAASGQGFPKRCNSLSISCSRWISALYASTIFSQPLGSWPVWYPTRRCTEKPCRSADSMVSRIALRHGSSVFSTACATELASSVRNEPNSFEPVPSFATSDCCWRSFDTSVGLMRRPSRSCVAKILLSTPPRSRTFLTGAFATASATPSSSVWPRSLAFLRMIATRVSYSGGPKSTIKPPEKRERSRASSPSMSAGGRSLARTIWPPAAVS